MSHNSIHSRIQLRHTYNVPSPFCVFLYYFVKSAVVDVSPSYIPCCCSKLHAFPLLFFAISFIIPILILAPICNVFLGPGVGSMSFISLLSIFVSLTLLFRPTVFHSYFLFAFESFKELGMLARQPSLQ